MSICIIPLNYTHDLPPEMIRSIFCLHCHFQTRSSFLPGVYDLLKHLLESINMYGASVTQIIVTLGGKVQHD